MNRREALKRSVAVLGFAAGASSVGGSAVSASATSASTIGASAVDTRRQSSFEPLGRVDVAGAKEAVVGDDGRTAYVATIDGFATVDVGDPETLAVLAERRNLLDDHQTGPLGQIHDVTVEGDRLVVPGPANPSDEPFLSGFLLYDVADPANPQQLAFYETDFPIHNAFVDGGIAYLTGNDGAGNPLVMVDIEGDAPEEVGRWSMLDYESGWDEIPPYLRTLHDVYVQDGVAYLAHWEAGTWLVDVSDPADPQHLATVGGRALDELAGLSSDERQASFNEPPGNDHYCMVSDGGALLAVGKESSDQDENDSTGGPSGIDLWDVSNLDSPTHLATIDPPAGDAVAAEAKDVAFGAGAACHECGANVTRPWTTAHNFDIVDDRLYSSWYQGGVKVHDISDPASPVRLAWWHDAPTASFWAAKAAADCLVASSHRNQRDGSERVYAFPLEG